MQDIYLQDQNIVICINENLNTKIINAIRQINCSIIDCSNVWESKQKKIINEKPLSYQKGDITVTENNEEHKYGHIAMWSGNYWISDFVQESEFVYLSNQPKVHYYRFTGM